MKHNGDWKRRCAELEVVTEKCGAAFELIPIWALERGQQWHPSEEAIKLLKLAKDAIRDYNEIHGHYGR